MQEKIQAPDVVAGSCPVKNTPFARAAVPGEAFTSIPEPLAVRYAPDGQLTYVNDAYCKYYNLEREYVLGRNFIQHRVPMDDLLRISRAVGTLSPILPDRWIRHSVVLADGRICQHVWLHRALFLSDGGMREFVATGMDITDVRDTELIRRIEHTIKQHNDSLCARSTRDS